MEEETIQDNPSTTTDNTTIVDPKIYDVNPLIATETEYLELKDNQLTTANNVKDILSDFVMPKLYLLFGVLTGLIFAVAIIVWFVSRKDNKPNVVGEDNHMLGGTITRVGF